MNNRSLESILDFIRKNSIEDIANFDMKDLWKDKIIEYTEKQMQRYVSNTYEIGNLTPLKKMCCYKISANELEIDCDVSLFSMVIFRLAFPISGIHLELQPGKKKEKYQLTGLDFTCVGDTMNSYATVTRNYIKTHYQNDSIYMPDRKGYLKWEYQMVSRNNYWEAAILDNYGDIENLLPNYIQEFLKVVHTIGNMIPVPKGCFNVPRNSYTDDYWDITLEGMYQNNFEKIIGPSTRARWSRKENVENCEAWFSNYSDWETFVKQTFMEPFVDENAKPILLCEKKKNKRSKRIPKNDTEYQRFYTNVTAMIEKRSLLIATNVKKIVDKNTNEQIINKYFKGVSF